MKRFAKMTAMFLLAAVIFSTLSGYVFATSISFRDFTKALSYSTYERIDDPQLKNETSPLFLYIDPDSFYISYNVRAISCNIDGTSQINSTMYNNKPVDHVVCDEGIYYSIKSTAAEDAGAYAVITLMCPAGGTVVGRWAPGSAQEFESPST